MRLCPSCRQRRKSDATIDTVHLCEECFKHIEGRHGGTTLGTIRDIGSLYSEFGLSYAGPLKGAAPALRERILCGK